MFDRRGWTQAELAERTGLTREYIDDLLRGRARIGVDTASRLDEVLGGTAQFWLTRDTRYRAALKHRQEWEARTHKADGLSKQPPS